MGQFPTSEKMRPPREVLDEPGASRYAAWKAAAAARRFPSGGFPEQPGLVVSRALRGSGSSDFASRSSAAMRARGTDLRDLG